MTRGSWVALAMLWALGCGDDGISGSTSETDSGTETTSASGDGDGDPGDGDPGDGDPGDGDGNPGDGDPGDGDPGDGDGDGDSGDGDPGDGDGDPGGALDDLLTLDHVQVKGTHNSYHVEPLIAFDASHEYTHPPLDVQLEDFGVRAFELDLHRSLVDGELLVYHILVVDEVTTCDSLVDCLLTIAGWSEQHPGHVPIMVWFEIKDSTGGMAIDDLLLVDQTILDVFEPAQVLTPDFVRGDRATLRAALELDGWPTLGEIRGKIMFMDLNGDHASVEDYTHGFTSLDGRLMFVSESDPTVAYAAVSKINDPASSNIADAHVARILTASNICGAGQSDEQCAAKLEAGKLSGTHNLMDDFLAPVDGMTYFLDLPDGKPVRCNEVTAPPECYAEAVEDLN